MRSHLRTHDGRTHSHRPAALAAGAAAVAAGLLATGCGGTAPTASAGTDDDTVFSTASFTLGSRGDVQLSGTSRTAVRPAGAYPVTAGRAHAFPRPAGALLVILRHWPEAVTERASRGRARLMPPPEEPAVETGYLVDTANWVRADLDGHPLQWLRRDTIRIDTTNATGGDRVRLTLSGPHGGRSGQPTPPPEDRACARLDRWTDRRVVLPEMVAGTPVGTALARLRKQCLDVQYASLPGDGRAGTVRQVLVPLAGPPDTAAVLPPDEGTDRPGDSVLVDPRRPATLSVTR
ncbi:hypothetical protein [Streptomyces sp. V4I2]|uniref:hypothetical protein n=1 Tax=Streptomyces sp. V4I2 TaxID=3042280 RepID=UPI002785C387|nr:hypothetical protein [Streptomyces sp. V4I2]MDQ1044894.1 hypothetical protein [Streptomyces sp. V4I2]